MLPDSTKLTQKGEAFERLLLTLVAHSPMRPERATILESSFLAAAHTGTDSTEELFSKDSATVENRLGEATKRNASKALGRMVTSEALREVIVPNGLNERINLPESGLVAVSVSLPVLQANHKIWVKNGRKGPEPTQELIAQTIRGNTVKWIVEERDPSGILLFLQDIWIVHGSNSIDMLILIMYRSSRDFMHYVREVIQKVDGVLGTQTMQISNNLAANHNQLLKE